MEKWRHEEMEKWRKGEMEELRNGEIENRENEYQDFSCVVLKVIHPMGPLFKWIKIINLAKCFPDIKNYD